MEVSVVRFNREHSVEFVSELRNRVNDYFKTNNLSVFGNASMVYKSIAILTLYFVPFAFILSGMIQSFWVMMAMWFLMALGMCGIGVSISHDANHGSYSKNKRVNKFMGYMLNVVGSYHVTWKIQHNVLHHSSTNVHEFDEDLDNQVMRFSPEQDQKGIFKYQAFYAPFFYGLLSLNKMLSKDFIQLFRYNKKRLLTSQGLTFRKAIIQTVAYKTVYMGVTLGVPILILSLPWWQVLVGFVTMHFVCGLILALIFQSAHVLEKTQFCSADEKGSVDNCWAIHQLNTTANFGQSSNLLGWLIGGLNFQVEHHLFPHICHVHYKDISHIVRQTAKDYNIAYNEYPSFLSAIFSHFRTLHALGQPAKA